MKQNIMEQKGQMGGMKPQICMTNPMDEYVGKQLMNMMMMMIIGMMAQKGQIMQIEDERRQKVEGNKDKGEKMKRKKEM
eukprot:13600520-Heterocapsa_arctica.AAC.1